MPDVPALVRRDFSLARLTTIRTGGDAEYFARPGTVEQLREILLWAGTTGLEVGVVGSGSNLLVADEGVRGLVLKLDRELSQIAVDSPRMLCGGGSRLPAVAARAAQEGLSGIEFGVNIPGTVGGAVRMNANAYGGELSRVLEWAEIVSADGIDRREPGQLGFAYRRSNLEPGEVVSQAAFRLEPAVGDQVRATLADLRARRKAAQPSGIKTFGSTFKNPSAASGETRTAGQLLDHAGCRGLRIGGAGFSDKHANFIENFGAASTADVVAVMVAGSERVRDRFGISLEPEVQTLGPVPLPEEWRG